MPYLKIHTNIQIREKKALMTSLSAQLSNLLGKPESYIMLAITDQQPMRFAASDDPLAFLELKSINLPVEQTKAFSRALCETISTATGISINRIYIEFTVAERALWGWNGTTFER